MIYTIPALKFAAPKTTVEMTTIVGYVHTLICTLCVILVTLSMHVIYGYTKVYKTVAT